MGLLLGGSVITVFELLDLIVFHFLTNLVKKAEPDSKPSTPDEKPALKDNSDACIDDLHLGYGGVYSTPDSGDQLNNKTPLDYPST
ncbi:MAG: amiloride-sensitive sodium channel family protein [Gammaproteobacteria bacterium]|nr:amiloride-sensitive sodium channel family protein [Gammaproteobacteria bacterium]